MDRHAGENRHLHFRTRVDDRRSDRIGAGLEPHRTGGDSLLTGPLVEQSQLHGTLDHLRQLGIDVVEFQTYEAEEDS